METNDQVVNTEKAEMLQLALDVANLGTWDYYPQTGELIWSAICSRLMGIDTDIAPTIELFIERIFPAHRERVGSAMEKAITFHQYDFCESFRVGNAQSEEKWLQSTGRALCNAEGETTRFIGTICDVTQAKRREEEIIEQNRVLEIFNRLGKMETSSLGNIVQSITDACTDLVKAEFGAFFYDVKDEKGEVNTLYKISGVAEEAFSKFPLPRKTEIFKPTLTGAASMHSDDITKDPRYGHNPPYNGIPKGHLPVKSFLSIPVISMKGNVIGGIFLGHSEAAMFTKESQELAKSLTAQASSLIDNFYLIQEINNSSERFSQLADAMPQIVWTAGKDGKTEYLNKKWLEYTALGDNGFDNWGKVVHEDDIENYAQRWRESVANGSDFQTEYRLLRHDGNYRWHLGRALPVRDENGDIYRWFGTSTDIHDYKTLSEELEKRVGERTEELSEAIDELQRSNQDLEQFAYVASHDLKEPLRMISSYTNLLERKYINNLKEEDKEFIHFILDGVARMGQLINDLLAFSRIGRSDVQFEKVDLNKVVATVSQEIEKRYPNKAQMSIGLLPEVNAVYSNMMQLFQNLMENAIKFNDSPNPKVEVNTEDKGSKWQISISDNGIGIDEKFVDRIFIIFQRLHTRDKYEGTGIGLSVCKKIVEFHGGRIWVKSTPGEGATFYFTLPKA